MGAPGRAEPADWPAAGAPTLAKLILGSGLVAGAAGMALFYLALSLGDISRVKPVAFTVAPATAVLPGWLVLHEPLTLTRALGASLVLIGVVLLAMR